MGLGVLCIALRCRKGSQPQDWLVSRSIVPCIMVLQSRAAVSGLKVVSLSIDAHTHIHFPVLLYMLCTVFLVAVLLCTTALASCGAR